MVMLAARLLHVLLSVSLQMFFFLFLAQCFLRCFLCTLVVTVAPIFSSVAINTCSPQAGFVFLVYGSASGDSSYA